MAKKIVCLLITLTLQAVTSLASQEPYTIYFAGELFDHKHLTGNVLLSQALEASYKDKYACILPQDLGKKLKNPTDPIEIRNLDIATLMQCDLALFNFDGTELDSGTVVEYMIAKMLDIPSVVLRTDFRKCGDFESIAWNLMVYGYPRTAIIHYHSLINYQHGIENMHKDISEQIDKAFESVIHTPTIFTNQSHVSHAYNTVPALCGSGLFEYITAERIAEIVQRKMAKGLYNQEKKDS